MRCQKLAGQSRRPPARSQDALPRAQNSSTTGRSTPGASSSGRTGGRVELAYSTTWNDPQLHHSYAGGEWSRTPLKQVRPSSSPDTSACPGTSAEPAEPGADRSPGASTRAGGLWRRDLDAHHAAARRCRGGGGGGERRRGASPGVCRDRRPRRLGQANQRCDRRRPAGEAPAAAQRFSSRRWLHGSCTAGPQAGCGPACWPQVPEQRGAAAVHPGAGGIHAPPPPPSPHPTHTHTRAPQAPTM
jgi:hypothetical protein